MTRIRGTVRLFSVALLLAAVPLPTGAAESSPQEPFAQAAAALRQGRTNDAIALADRAVAAEPKNAQLYFERGRLRAALRQGDQAIADFDQALKLAPNATMVHQHRGVEHFKRGGITEAIADFDAYLKAHPQQEPHHWQRGIAYYYAGRFADGRRQFEVHRTVNPDDVENAAWHFLCAARADGVEQARTNFLQLAVENDRRVPMRQIYELFAGKGKPADVLAAARAGNPPPDRLRDQLFYAHLYLGLYHEALGDATAAREHILKAADEYPADHYMGDVARVHARRFRR